MRDHLARVHGIIVQEKTKRKRKDEDGDEDEHSDEDDHEVDEVARL
jgi:hypothetical protein